MVRSPRFPDSLPHTPSMPSPQLPFLTLFLVLWLASTPSSQMDEALDAPPTALAVKQGVVQVRLLPDTTRWIPGRTHYVGVRFEMDDGWHLYWPGQNDSGLPIQVIPELPPGFTAGALGWPAPERLIHGGEFVDHVYHDEVTLLLPITVAEDVPAGARVELAVATDWLVCEEACVPGAAAVSLEMLVAAAGEAPGASEAAPELEALKARLPGPPLPGLQALTIKAMTTASAAAGSSTAADPLRAPLIEVSVAGARRLAFYPYEDGLPLVHVASSCAAEGALLRLEVDPEPPYRPEHAGPARLRGLLEIWYDKPPHKRRSQLVWVDHSNPHDPKPTSERH